ncbi:AAA family ATPase [Marinilabiliaceae bacterium ANBcel2]|nr:AAA family ATPase [Marinilabiliaceae bacterium ANBcel2]
MLKDYFLSRLHFHFPHEPTVSQSVAIDKMSSFVALKQPNYTFLLKGYAGTGKTLLIKSLVTTLRESDFNAVLLAPTGRAAKVLSKAVDIPAYTIHKYIYNRESSIDYFSGFKVSYNRQKSTFFIVDEASMISNESSGGAFFGSGRLLDDLIEFVYKGTGCKLIIVGDTAQLPPVSTLISPALDADYLSGYGREIIETELRDVVRQHHDSGILYNATTIRTALSNGFYEGCYPKLETVRFNDTHALNGAEVQEEINRCYDLYGEEETLIICRSNKRSNLYNTGIRNTILFKEDEISTGDYLLITRNNYYWVKDHPKIEFIANGDIGKVVRIKNYHNMYGYRFADITCELMDYKDVDIDVRINLDTLQLPGAGFSVGQQEEFYNVVMEDYQDISSAKKRYESLQSNQFFNALQVKFAYAMTCHKSQGGQWKAVFIDMGYFKEEYLGRDLYRWLYTAVTRASEQLYFINFPKEFYSDKMRE